ncbi:hypothetical protein ACF0H5_004958 [Mactra antiquata]
MSKYRMDVTRKLHFRFQTTNNETYLAIVDNREMDYDNIGALYYVVAVVLIYGLSIVMMIASHIRRNKQDGQLRSYLKEMAAIRKKNRREQLLEKMTDLATKSGPYPGQKVEETTFIETTKKEERVSSLYARLPTEADEESHELLLSKNSNSFSYSDNDDSVFQNSPSTPTPTLKAPESPMTPKISPPSKLLTPKLVRSSGKTFFQIEVINENAPL